MRLRAVVRVLLTPLWSSVSVHERVLTGRRGGQTATHSLSLLASISVIHTGTCVRLAGHAVRQNFMLLVLAIALIEKRSTCNERRVILHLLLVVVVVVVVVLLLLLLLFLLLLLHLLPPLLAPHGSLQLC